VLVTPRSDWPKGHAFGVGLLDDGSYRFWLPRRLVLSRLAFHTPTYVRRRRLAWLRSLYWWLIRNYESEICDRCGGPVEVVFHAPDAIWELATGYPRFPDGEAAPGCLCVACVDELVEPKIDGYLTWTCAVTR
jgi:hypothetical protein